MKINKLCCLLTSGFSLICKQVLKCFDFFSCLLLTFKILWISMQGLSCRMTSLRYKRTRMWDVSAHLICQCFNTEVFLPISSLDRLEKLKKPPMKPKESWLFFRSGDLLLLIQQWCFPCKTSVSMTLYTVKGIYRWEISL